MSDQQTPMTYAGTGVDYGSMDPFKIACQRRATLTARNIERFGLRSLEELRGESAYVMYELARDNHHKFYGHVEEGLGTKNLVADAVRKITGKTYYNQVAQDTIAMAVNDLITLGISPVSVAMHLAVGDSKWFDDAARVQDLVNGWGDTCDLARCVWGPGETPTLKGIIYPEASLLSGSTFGIAKHNKLIDAKNIQEGDAIVLLESSGIHANGLTLARKIADNLPDGYATKLSDGRMYGEALLDPTHIYCDFVEDCLDAGVDIHYCVNITGHGWRKLMRAKQPFAYVMKTIPKPQPVFDFIQQHGPVNGEEMYGNFNMGAGFALYIPPSELPKLDDVLVARGERGVRRFNTWHMAGRIEKSDVKKVVIEPKGITFEANTLAVR